MPAARDETAERAVRRRIELGVKRLRIEPARELDDLLGRDLVRAVLRLVARLKVLPVLQTPKPSGSGRA
jgi:hypothetical protein